MIVQMNFRAEILHAFRGRKDMMVNWGIQMKTNMADPVGVVTM